MAEFEDRHWTSEDGLRLHYRDYPHSGDGPADKSPVICIPGLTRNARDFEDLADKLATRRRVLCLDLRGRGDSAYAKDPATYTPLTYVADLGVVYPKLVTVVAQRQRLRQVVGQRGKAAEMRAPRLVAQPPQTHRRGMGTVAEAQQRFGKVRARHRIADPAGQPEDARIGAIRGGLRFGAHPAIVGGGGAGRKPR